jgi:NADH dehydrogenase FAD-containing subunit
VTKVAERHQVLVVGGGFGGLSLTKALAHADVDVTIVDHTNHHLFQPLLYQVATGILSEGVIAPPLRGVVKNQANARTVLAEVTRFDLDKKTVYGVSPDGRTLQRRYDTLVVAGGATHAYFGHDEWAAFAPGMKTLEDARRLRSRILSAFEMAETVADPRNERHSSRSSSSARDRPGWSWPGRSPSWRKRCCHASFAGSTPARRPGWCLSKPLRRCSDRSTRSCNATPSGG